MADNLTSKDATGATVTLATDEISSVHFTKFKNTVGAADVDEGTVAKSNGMPVQESCPASLVAVTTVANATWTGLMANLTITGISGARRVEVYNDTNGTLALSQDGGTTIHKIVPPGAVGTVKCLASITALWGKYIVQPTTGNVYFTPEF